MARSNELIDIFLQPGEYFVGNEGYQIRTMLGSCVSITLWHPSRRIGAMSHFLLPRRGTDAKGCELDARYGDEALSLMLAELAQAGIEPWQCQGKIFGGGNMFPSQSRPSCLNIGRRNGEAARAMLQAHGIRTIAESLLGIGHRQIIFDVSTGDVWSHQVRPITPPN